MAVPPLSSGAGGLSGHRVAQSGLHFSDRYVDEGSHVLDARVRGIIVTMMSISEQCCCDSPAGIMNAGTHCVTQGLRDKGLFWELNPGPLAP